MMKDKVKCPNCGKETMPKIWNGFNPPICPECGHQGENIKIDYRF